MTSNWNSPIDIQNVQNRKLIFERNCEYVRKNIHEIYSGQRQGGISTPSDHPFIFLFTGEKGEKYGYKDGWTEDGIFYLTGEGQKKDMQFSRGNLAIKEHTKTNKELLLFSIVGNGIVKFIDHVVSIGWHEDESRDIDGNPRKIIVFELLPVSSLKNQEQLIRESEFESDSLEDLRKKALDSSQTACTSKERKIIYFIRSNAIKEFALNRANGFCEGCGEPAPFITSSRKPYLEVHHIKRLSDEGPDHPESVVAVCPNCHRRAHYAEDAIEFNNALGAIALEKESVYSQ